MALTPIKDLYDAFLALLETDEWENMDEMDMTADLLQIAKASFPWFKFPRCSFELDESNTYFIDENVSNDEIQILALFMKMNWYTRVIDSWENLRPLYTERDFSPANEMREYSKRSEDVKKRALDLEKVYYRSIKGKPYDYMSFAGG